MVIVSWLLVIPLSCLEAEQNDSLSALFYKANIAYEQGKFDEAIKGYENALKSGLKSGNVYFNLGNTYFKKGEIGRAVLNYKRAQRLIPNDRDLAANLEYAMSLTEQQNTPRMNFMLNLALNFIKGLSMDALTGFLIILYLLIFFLAIIFLFISASRPIIKAPLIILCLIFAITAAGFFMKAKQANQPWAVILDKEVEAKYEPFDSATTYFKAFQGHDILLLKLKGDWAFIKRPDGKAGWVRASALEKI